MTTEQYNFLTAHRRHPEIAARNDREARVIAELVAAGQVMRTAKGNYRLNEAGADAFREYGC